MKNNTYIIGALLSLSFAFTSCNDFLDKLPDNRIEIRKPEDATRLLVTAYPETHPAYLFEMYSDNVDEHDNPSWSAADRFQEQAFKWQIKRLLTNFGTAIIRLLQRPILCLNISKRHLIKKII